MNGSSERCSDLRERVCERFVNKHVRELFVNVGFDIGLGRRADGQVGEFRPCPRADYGIYIFIVRERFVNCS